MLFPKFLFSRELMLDFGRVSVGVLQRQNTRCIYEGFVLVTDSHECRRGRSTILRTRETLGTVTHGHTRAGFLSPSG